MDGDVIQTSYPDRAFDTPVLFLVYNRPEATRKVFEAIGRVQPGKLYVAGDGPREEKEGEIEKIEQVRRIATEADWDCEIRTLFRDENLGCRKAVTEALDWFFEKEPEGIILEDDCLPSVSYFRFCQVMLERYRGDDRVMMISGHNRQGAWKAEERDYLFSNLGGIWGWASWREAWKKNDGQMTHLDELLESGYLRDLLGEKTGSIRERQLRRARDEQVDSWDYAWGYSRHIHNGMCVVPSKNLVTNIGFGEEATHTKAVGEKELKRHELDFPLRVNPVEIPDKTYDDLFFESPSLAGRALGRLKKTFRGGGDEQ